MDLVSSVDTELDADAVEFCPDEAFASIAICGTYKLEESNAGGRAEHQTRSGVFDIKWLCLDTHADLLGAVREAPHEGNLVAAQALLGHAAADGCLYTYTLTRAAHDDDRSTPSAARLTKFADIDCRADDAPDGTLALSLAWDARHCHVAVSMSDGSVCVARLSPTGLTLDTAWQAHDLEAWICAYDVHHANVLYTGADDAKFKMWDVRHAGEAAVQTRANSRTHTAGVCSIQSHPTREFCIATGSYDEYVRVWDTRNFKTPVNETSVGGGVWRLKWHPSGSDMLLCAAMHNQFAVLNWGDAGNTDSAGDFSALRTSPTAYGYSGGHTSLGYGVDWMQHTDTTVVASASFYDHRFEVWRVTSDFHGLAVM